MNDSSKWEISLENVGIEAPSLNHASKYFPLVGINYRELVMNR